MLTKLVEKIYRQFTTQNVFHVEFLKKPSKANCGVRYLQVYYLKTLFKKYIC